MKEETLQILGLPSYAALSRDAGYRPACAADLWNESAALQIGKWVRALHQVDVTQVKEKLPDLAEELRQEIRPACLAPYGATFKTHEIQETLLLNRPAILKAMQALPKVPVLRSFSVEQILLAKDHTGAVLDGEWMLGYRYWDVRQICSCLHSWGQWAFLWGYAIPLSEQEKTVDALLEPLLLLNQAKKTEDEALYTRLVRLLDHPKTQKALSWLSEE